MLSDPLSQRIAEISEALEILRAQSVNHPDKAAEILSNAIGPHQVSLEGLTTLAWGGEGGENEVEFDIERSRS